MRYSKNIILPIDKDTAISTLICMHPANVNQSSGNWIEIAGCMPCLVGCLIAVLIRSPDPAYRVELP